MTESEKEFRDWFDMYTACPTQYRYGSTVRQPIDQYEWLEQIVSRCLNHQQKKIDELNHYWEDKYSQMQHTLEAKIQELQAKVMVAKNALRFYAQDDVLVEVKGYGVDSDGEESYGVLDTGSKAMEALNNLNN